MSRSTNNAVYLARGAYQDRPTVFAAGLLGWALKLSGSSPEAMAFTEESIRLGTPDATLLLHVATIFEANGDHPRAAELREQASVVDPCYRASHPEQTHWLLNSFTIPLGFRGDLFRRLRRP